MKKQAWIIEPERIVSFHWVEGSKLYEDEEAAFWECIKSLMHQGYRIQ